ncbi:MAG: hypothetical protein VB042_03680 [Victivallaceae bacterium]|nr:hypothetical protein [Victivallaceae bacterium]
MKKLMLLAILLTGLQGWAIYQYGGYVGKTTDSAGNTIYQYSYKDNGKVFSFEVVEGAYNSNPDSSIVSGSAYMIRVTAGTGSIYLTDKISNIYNMDANKEVFSNFVNVGTDGTGGNNYGWRRHDPQRHR